MKKWSQYAVAIGLIVLLIYALKPEVGSTHGHRRDDYMNASAHLRSAAIHVTGWMSSGTRIKHLKSLDDLPADCIPYRDRRYFDPESGRAFDWLYYGADYRSTYPSNRFILMAAPTLFGPAKDDPNKLDNAFRVVVYLDTHTERLTEKEFRQRIQLQQQDIIKEGTYEK